MPVMQREGIEGVTVMSTTNDDVRVKGRAGDKKRGEQNYSWGGGVVNRDDGTIVLDR